MRISLESLQTIEAIARCGTFATAAQELHKTSSSLSYLVQKLETDLGVTVFDRSGHRVRLTETGKVLVEEGRQLLRASHQLEERLQRVESGWEAEVRIAVDANLPFEMLTSYIAAFSGERSYTHLLFSQEVLGATWETVAARRADLGIGTVAAPTSEPGLSSIPIGKLETVFVVAPGHPLADADEPIDCNTLSRYRFVEIGRSDSASESLQAINGERRLTVPNLQAKIAVLLAGIASDYLPRCVAVPLIASGQLVAKRLCEERPAQTIYLTWRSEESGRALAWWVEQLSRSDFEHGADIGISLQTLPR